MKKGKTEGITLDEIMSGGEPSVEQKQRAKQLAWSNGRGYR